MRAPLLLVAAAVLVALAMCASAAPLLRRPDGLATIEWRALPASSELALHIYTSGAAAPKSQLFSFDDDATVGALLQSQLVADLAADHAMTAEDCFVSSGTLRVAAQYPLLRALQATPARSLHCGKVSWRFVQFVKPVLRPNEARAANALKRSVSGADADYPLSSAELISDDWAGVWGWVDAFLKNHWGPLHPYNDYVGNTEQTGRWHLNTGAVLQPGSSFGSESDAPVRIAIAADWAAGTRESDYVQQVMMVGNGTAYEPHWTLHVGDIYYVGDSAAVQSNCLGIAPAGTAQGVKWPHGSIGSFAVEGNHEMYARAIGFLDTFLPTLGVTLPSGGVTGQAAGYVALENAYWRVIMLDTGYNTYSLVPKMDNKNNTQPQAVIDWLINEVNIGNVSDTRGLIFFTHHQVESAFEEPFLATPQQIAEIMPPNRTVVWLWGHEHRVSWYNLFSLANATVPLNIYGRCVGNGGFPGSVSAIPPRAKTAGLMVYDDRVYELETGFFNSSVSYNGWVHLSLEKNTASLVYSSLATDPKSGLISNEIQTDLVAETFVVDEDGNVSLESFEVVNPDLTVIH